MKDNKKIKILLAAPRGFCAGVDRGIEIVKIVSGRAFFMNVGKPFDKFLFISLIKEIECLIECKKQK